MGAAVSLFEAPASVPDASGWSVLAHANSRFPAGHRAGQRKVIIRGVYPNMTSLMVPIS